MRNFELEEQLSEECQKILENDYFYYEENPESPMFDTELQEFCANISIGLDEKDRFIVSVVECGEDGVGYPAGYVRCDTIEEAEQEIKAEDRYFMVEKEAYAIN